MFGIWCFLDFFWGIGFRDVWDRLLFLPVTNQPRHQNDIIENHGRDLEQRKEEGESHIIIKETLQLLNRSSLGLKL